MIQFCIRTKDSPDRQVTAKQGESLMLAIKNHHEDAIEAICGGQLQCATCHVHVDEKLLAQLPPISEREQDLLDFSDHLTEFSRLSCQLVIDETFAGMVFRLPEDQYQ